MTNDRILGLAKLAEYRDEDTGSHLERIREYAKILAIELSKKETYTEYISQDYIDVFKKLAPQFQRIHKNYFE